MSQTMPFWVPLTDTDGVEPAKEYVSGDCDAGVVPKAPLAKLNALATPP